MYTNSLGSMSGQDSILRDSPSWTDLLLLLASLFPVHQIDHKVLKPVVEKGFNWCFSSLYLNSMVKKSWFQALI